MDYKERYKELLEKNRLLEKELEALQSKDEGKERIVRGNDIQGFPLHFAPDGNKQNSVPGKLLILTKLFWPISDTVRKK